MVESKRRNTRVLLEQVKVSGRLSRHEVLVQVDDLALTPELGPDELVELDEGLQSLVREVNVGQGRKRAHAYLTLRVPELVVQNLEHFLEIRFHLFDAFSLKNEIDHF